MLLMGEIKEINIRHSATSYSSKSHKCEHCLGNGAVFVFNLLLRSQKHNDGHVFPSTTSKNNIEKWTFVKL